MSNATEYVSGSPGITHLPLSLKFCAAFFLAVRGDVTFVWESVRNHVIVIDRMMD
jgi:hypothetical protein